MQEICVRFYIFNNELGENRQKQLSNSYMSELSSNGLVLFFC